MAVSSGGSADEGLRGLARLIARRELERGGKQSGDRGGINFPAVADDQVAPEHTDPEGGQGHEIGEARLRGLRS